MPREGIIYRSRTDAQNEFHSLVDQHIGQGRGSSPMERRQKPGGMAPIYVDVFIAAEQNLADSNKLDRARTGLG